MTEAEETKETGMEDGSVTTPEIRNRTFNLCWWRESQLLDRGGYESYPSQDGDDTRGHGVRDDDVHVVWAGPERRWSHHPESEQVESKY